MVAAPPLWPCLSWSRFKVYLLIGRCGRLNCVISLKIAPQCTKSRYLETKNRKKNSGEGHCPLPRLLPQWGGGYPSPHLTPSAPAAPRLGSRFRRSASRKTLSLPQTSGEQNRRCWELIVKSMAALYTCQRWSELSSPLAHNTEMSVLCDSSNGHN